MTTDTTDPIAAARALLGRVPHLFIDKDGDLCRTGGGHNLVGCPAEDDEPPFGLLNPWVWRAIPELRDMAATLADTLEGSRITVAALKDRLRDVEAERDQALARLEAVQKENERLRESLRRISSPQYGLQGLIEDGASEGEITQYWANLASSFATTARFALRNPTAATPDTDAQAALHSTEASNDD